MKGGRKRAGQVQNGEFACFCSDTVVADCGEMMADLFFYVGVGCKRSGIWAV